MAGTIHQSDYRLAFCRKRWRRRLNDDDDDDDGDYVDGMLMMVVMVTVMLIMLMDPTRKVCSKFGSSRLTCFSLERRRRRRDGKKGRAASWFSRPRPRREEAGLEGAKSAKAEE